jgi:hypothetical protein
MGVRMQFLLSPLFLMRIGEYNVRMCKNTIEGSKKNGSMVFIMGVEW